MFQIMPLAAAQFAYLGDLSDAELRQNHVQVHISDGTMPCRVSLQDAEQGAKVLLLNYEHQPAQSPYRSSHAIFVKENAVEADVAQGAVPDMLAKRLLSIRAFNSAHEIIDAEVCDGKTIEQHILRFFWRCKNRLYSSTLCASWMLCGKSSARLGLFW